MYLINPKLKTLNPKPCSSYQCPYINIPETRNHKPLKIAANCCLQQGSLKVLSQEDFMELQKQSAPTYSPRQLMERYLYLGESEYTSPCLCSSRWG